MIFELTQKVHIKASGERGEVVGRAEYTHSEDSYLLRYQSADGRAVEQWWSESAIQAA